MDQNTTISPTAAPAPPPLDLLAMIGRIDRLLREQRKTASRMSRDLGFSSGLYSQWKQGKQSPSADRLYRIAIYLGTSVDYLVGLEPDTEDARLRHEIMQTLELLSPQALERIRDFARFMATQPGFGCGVRTDSSR